MDRLRVHDCINILAGLPSTQLTHLHLGVRTATMPLMGQIARFRHLEELSLTCSYQRVAGLDLLTDLRCLTWFALSVRGPPDRQEAALAAIRAKLARLQLAVFSSSAQMGVKVGVGLFYQQG